MKVRLPRGSAIFGNSTILQISTPISYLLNLLSNAGSKTVRAWTFNKSGVPRESVILARPHNMAVFYLKDLAGAGRRSVSSWQAQQGFLAHGIGAPKQEASFHRTRFPAAAKISGDVCHIPPHKSKCLLLA